ncbi:MAG: helix-turn-helix transcriptional regulator [Amphritea sp.]
MLFGSILYGRRAAAYVQGSGPKAVAVVLWRLLDLRSPFLGGFHTLLRYTNFQISGIGPVIWMSYGHDCQKGRLQVENKRALDPMDILVARNVRERRIYKGLSQAQLAAMLDVSFQQMQKYEKGRNRISAGRLHKIAVTLQCPEQYFFENSHFVMPETQGIGFYKLLDVWEKMPKELRPHLLKIGRGLIRSTDTDE